MFKDLTCDKIYTMSYTDFVALINQWNVPPGSLSTINEWSVFGHVDRSSTVLEIACTTGFSSRELARLTNCTALGVDISAASIEAAKFNAEYYGKGLQLHYQCGDATAYQPEQKLTHVILGASLGFFNDPHGMLRRICSFFDQTGYILASPYFSKGTMPEQVKKDCRRVIGIEPTITPYEEIRDFYQDYETVYESRKDIVLETEQQMRKYTADTVTRACELRKIESDSLYQAMFNRLYEIKAVSNEIHRYQGYSVLVLRYMKSVFPNRFVEYF